MREFLRAFASGLSDEALGEALLGVVTAGEVTVDDRRRARVPATFKLRRPRVSAKARDAIAEWHEFVGDAPPGLRPGNAHHGLAIGVPLDGFRSEATRHLVVPFARALYPAPNLAALHFVDGPPTPAADWQWPLDVAVTPDAWQKTRGWLGELRWQRFTTPIEANHATSPIEILLHPGSLSDAISAVSKLPPLPRVQAVLVLGATMEEDAVDLARELRAAARADAVCVVGTRAPRRRFLDDVLYQLSHDVDLDVAITLACRRNRLAAPLLIAVEDAFARAHASAWTRNVAEALASHDDLMVTANGHGAEAAATVARDLEERTERLAWESESSSASMVERVARGVRAAAPGRTRKQRYVNAKLYAGERLVEHAPLHTGPHHLDVWIGEPTERAMVARRSLRLTPSTVGHDLTIVFTAPAVLDRPVVRATHLPPDNPSQPVRFDFAIPDTLDRLEARIAVLHGNRILQTLKLAAAVGHGKRAKLQLALECVTRVDLDAAADGRPFDAAFLFNQLGNEDSMSLYQDGKASLIELANITAFLADIAVVLQKATDDPNSYRKLDSKESVDFLRALAHHGVLLKKRLFSGALAQAEHLAKAKRIQVISAKPEGMIPVELCYDPPAPDLPQDDGSGGAGLCKHWKTALAKGACDKKCTADKATVVCPVGFWGMSRVIERRVYSRTRIGANDFALLPDPATTRTVLKVLDGSLCAAAKQARDTDAKGKEVNRAFAAIKKATKGRDEVDTWQRWKSTVKTKGISLFVLLPHTEADDHSVSTLWIGANKTGLANIDESFRGPAGNGVLVLLLGCSTATVDTFASYTSQFQIEGKVPIVIGTLSEILGRHAAPIAEQLVTELAALPKRPGGTPFGDVMTRLRRKLLAKGFPIVMSIAAFGDAEWKV